MVNFFNPHTRIFTDFKSRRRGREREKEKNIDMREEHRLVDSHIPSDQGQNPPPRYVPQLEIEPAPLSMTTLKQTEPPSHDLPCILYAKLIIWL